MKFLKYFFLMSILLGVLVAGLVGAFVYSLVKDLPSLESLKDYEPKLVTQVFDRNGKKIGEFFREKRILVPYEEIPLLVIQAFIAAEDADFYNHKGIAWQGIFRAAWANFRAGRTVQGASTITQQVAKTFFLSSERTYDRKIKELFLARRMEQFLTKQEIMYLYLNQIFFGQNSYGIKAAADTYFRKPLDKITLAEAAILAGLPQAPSAYSPIRHPQRAKARQQYVLRRMVETGVITQEDADKAGQEPVKVFGRDEFREQAPFFVETVRIMLVQMLGETKVLDGGLRVQTTLDLNEQLKAQRAVDQGLRELDKRQGFRGALERLETSEERASFLEATYQELFHQMNAFRIIQADGQFVGAPVFNATWSAEKGLPKYIKVGDLIRGVVTRVVDQPGVVFVEAAELKGAIDFATMQWARAPNPERRWDRDQIDRPSRALKVGDVVWLRLSKSRFDTAELRKRLRTPPQNWSELEGSLQKHAQFELEQEPLVEAALLALDSKADHVISMVGGRDFEKSKFNRALQAMRQTGSVFKTFVYAAGLDRGMHPSTLLMDAPLVYENQSQTQGDEGQGVWAPGNFSDSFSGDVSLRYALVRSLNVPSVKIIEQIGVPYSIEYLRRLGLFSPLNPDLTLVLGSSSLTLYEITRAFHVFNKLGKKVVPVYITSVTDAEGEPILGEVSLDVRYEREILPHQEALKAKREKYIESLKAQDLTFSTVPKEKAHPFFFEDEDQLISPQTAYLITTLLRATIEDPEGTAVRAQSLGAEIAGKTGSTNKYFDAWFVGYSPELTTGVWVGFDQERSLGVGEVGGRTALPIWMSFMREYLDQKPRQSFTVPEGIIFMNVDAKTGRLPQDRRSRVVRQAFREDNNVLSDPAAKQETERQDLEDFLREDH